MLLNRQETRNIVVLIVAQALTAGIGIVTFLRLATALTVVDLGRLNFVIASTLLFGLLAELGVRYIVMREVAQEPSRARMLFWYAQAIRWFLSVSSMALLAICILIIKPWQGERTLLLLANLVAVTTFAADPAIYILYGRGRADLAGILLIIDRTLYMLAVLVAVDIFRNAESIILAELVTNVLRAVIAWWWVGPFLSDSLPLRADWELFKRLFWASAAQGLAVLAYVTYSRLTVVIVQSNVSPEALGYYSFAFSVVTLLLFAPTALLNALYPTLARGTEHNISNMHQQLAWLVLVVLLPLAFGLFMFADQAITIWIDARYAPSVILVRILTLSTVASALRLMYRQILLALNKPLLSIITDLVGIALLLSLGIVIVNYSGGLGIAVLFTAQECLLLMLMMFGMRRWVGVPPYLFLMLRGMVACLLPGLLAHQLAKEFYPRLVIYGLGTIVCMLAFGVISLGQLRAAKGAARQMFGRVIK